VSLVAAGCGTSAPTTEQVHADWVAKVNAAIKDPARAQRVAEQGGQLIDEEQSMVAALCQRFRCWNSSRSLTSAV
jgi:hypothetical protein